MPASPRPLAPVLWAGLIALAARPAPAFRIAKADFPRFAGSLDCQWDGEACPGAARGFVVQGRVGNEIPDPTAPDLAAGGKVVLGFLEGKPFSWPRYAADFPSAKSRWVVLNELSSGDQNNVFLTLWKPVGDSLEFVKAHPQALPLDLGETFVHAKATLPDNSLLLVLKGEGSDAGMSLQDYRFLRLRAPDKVEAAGRRTNRSEVAVQKILDKINNDEPVEAVTDSSLACEIVKGKKAPSGGPLIRFVKTRTSILYTKSGPQETPLGKEETTWDIWKDLKGKK
jgi:hypothetical protein